VLQEAKPAEAAPQELKPPEPAAEPALPQEAKPQEAAAQQPVPGEENKLLETKEKP
jgi:hypothetical protein